LYNFLLKRKLAIGVKIKVVSQITIFFLSGQKVSIQFLRGDIAFRKNGIS
jgi:hypothetical protein